MNDPDCPFCAPPPEAVYITDDLAFAMWDAFPVQAGYALIISRRHIATFHETTPEERASLYRLLDTVRLRVIDEHQPDGFNIGINEAQRRARPSTIGT